MIVLEELLLKINRIWIIIISDKKVKGTDLRVGFPLEDIDNTC